ncbi:MAG: glycosyltransferase family 2 protein [Verrucomicrobia bacterium]|nr:glycosyltransferase family 2 protein [Verrucomicrobiota bacterium]
MRVSVVVPVFNEADNVPILAEELAALRTAIPELEILFVDDGSQDNTWNRIEAAGRKHPCIRGIRCPTNRGQTNAMLTGMRAAQGEAIALIDGDLQNDPQDIPRLLAALDAQCDAVCGFRAKRRDTWSRRAASRVGNRIRNWVTHDGVRDTGCTLKVLRAPLVWDVPPVDGAHRFLPAYFRLHGRRIKEMPVNHRPRQHGQSKYTNWKRLPRTAFDLIGFIWYRKRVLRRLGAKPGTA